MLKLSQQKNALIGGLLGGVGGGQLVILTLDAYTNVHLDAHEGALVAAGISTVLLWAARPIRYVLQNGVVGGWQRILHGKAGAAPSGPEGEPGTAPGAVTLTDTDVSRIAAALRDALAAPGPSDG